MTAVVSLTGRQWEGQCVRSADWLHNFLGQSSIYSCGHGLVDVLGVVL